MARVLIIGGGVAGPVTAMALRRAGIQAAVYGAHHPGAKKAVPEIRGAEDKAHALQAVTAFQEAHATRWPKAAAKITDEVGALLALDDYPAERWVHLQTTNPIGSTFATCRHRPARPRRRLMTGPDVGHLREAKAA